MVAVGARCTIIGSVVVFLNKKLKACTVTSADWWNF